MTLHREHSNGDGNIKAPFIGNYIIAIHMSCNIIIIIIIIIKKSCYN